MVKRDELVNFLDKYFKPYQEMARSREMLVNGLQLKGADEVNKVGLGVSSSLEFSQKANDRGCNFLIVHHGLSFSSIAKTNVLTEPLESRLRFLFQKNISLVGYHALLDHHPEIGNNTAVLKKLGVEILGNVFDKWGWYGRFKRPNNVDEIVKECEKIYQHPARLVGEVKEEIQTIAVVSGSGAVDYHNPEIMNEFLEKEIELEIVGDLREGHPAFAKEVGLAIAAFGHYNTETIGIKNLGEVIKKEFPDLPVEFIDIPNDL